MLNFKKIELWAFEIITFLRFPLGLFSPTCSFSGGFCLWQISLKQSVCKMHFFSIWGLDGSSPNSLGPPEEELKSEFNGKVARNNGSSNSTMIKTKNTLKERSMSLLTFETFEQSDEKT